MAPPFVIRSWHFDNVTNELSYLLSGNRSTSNVISYTYEEDPCPVAGCPVPEYEDEPLETDFRYWSNPLQWASGRVPDPGENITILSRWKMMVDVDNVVVDHLTVRGHLEFAHKNINLTASMVGNTC